MTDPDRREFEEWLDAHRKGPPPVGGSVPTETRPDAWGPPPVGGSGPQPGETHPAWSSTVDPGSNASATAAVVVEPTLLFAGGGDRADPRKSTTAVSVGGEAHRRHAGVRLVGLRLPLN